MIAAMLSIIGLFTALIIVVQILKPGNERERWRK